MKWLGDVFYTRVVRAKHKPPTFYAVYWALWTIMAFFSFWWLVVVDHMALWLRPYSWLLFSWFVAAEGVAAFSKVPGDTYSEWNWWYVPTVLVRSIWTFALVLQAWLFIHPLFGMLLMIWLFPHLTVKGRDNRFFWGTE